MKEEIIKTEIITNRSVDIDTLGAPARLHVYVLSGATVYVYEACIPKGLVDTSRFNDETYYDMLVSKLHGTPHRKNNTVVGSISLEAYTKNIEKN